MKRQFITLILALALTIGAQAQQRLRVGEQSSGMDDGMDAMMAAMIAAKIHQDSIDTSSLVAMYDYECQTQDADGKAVTDRMKVCLQVRQKSRTFSLCSRKLLRLDKKKFLCSVLDFS